MKRTLILMILLPCLLLSACTAPNAAYYEHAQLLLGRGDFAGAAKVFDRLGEYRDAADYALYSAALHALSEGNLPLARADLLLIDPFKSSERYLCYTDAAILEAEGELEAALDAFTALGSFEDSLARADRLREAIPCRSVADAQSLMAAGRWQQALDLLTPLGDWEDAPALADTCREQLRHEAYRAADALFVGGEYEAALTAFESLGDVLDAPARAQMCRSSLYAALEARYAAVTLKDAKALMDDYAALGDYLHSADRLAALRTRFGTNLRVAATAGERPHVRFGAYPTGESGATAPLTWQVIACEGDRLTLLCTHVIDALCAADAAAPALILTEAEAAASATVQLPLREQLSALAPEALRAQATPYALAQGVLHHSDGSAWWWLADPLPNDRRLIVWYTGAVIPSGVAAAERTIGLRPLMTLSLNDYAFTAGSGSPEDPFR